jgi:hypothetical protein
MKVRMLVKVSGGRGDGSDWPEPGGELTVDDAEGRHLCAAHLAVPVVEERAEKAVPAETDVETRAPKSRSTRPKS